MARKPEATRIRILNDGIVDEQGQHWDRVRSGTYYLTSDDVADVVGHASRFLTTDGYGTAVVEVTQSEFQAALSKALEHRVSAYRSVQERSAVTLLLDTSDC